MNRPPPAPERVEIRGDRVSIRPFEESDARELLELRLGNREFNRPYEPSTVVVPETMEEQLDRFAVERKEWEDGIGFAFGIFRLDDGRLAGRIALSHVSRGGWQNAVLGYFV